MVDLQFSIPAMVRANGGLPQGAKKITAAQGHVPNFAAGLRGTSTATSYEIGGVTYPKNTIHSHLQKKTFTAAQAKKAGYVSTKDQRAQKASMQYQIPAKTVGIGAVVGVQSGAKTRDPYSKFSTILASKSKSKVANPTLLKYMQAHPTKTAHITGLPVAGINKVDKNEKTEAAMERKFRSDLNDHMLDALNDYAGFIFKSLFRERWKGFCTRPSKK